MREYVVQTHLGEERTVAKSEARALSNVKYRYRKMGYFGPYECWTVSLA